MATAVKLDLPGTVRGEVIPAPNTPEWLAWRRKGLGASDVPTILGLNPYRSVVDLWAEKRGLFETVNEGNRFTQMGHRMEPVIVSLYAEDNPQAVVAEAMSRRHEVLDYFFATPDRLLLTPSGEAVQGLLECKNRSERQAAKWGEAGTDQVPEDVLAQVMAQLAVWPEASACDVAVLLGGNDFRVYRIHRDDAVESAILQHVEDFWSLVTRGIEPKFEGPRLNEYVARRFRWHDAEMVPADQITEHAMRDLLTVRAEKARLEQTEKDLEAQIKHAIGEHAGIVGSVAKATWKKSRDSQVIDWEGVAEELAPSPALIAKHTKVKEGSRRFLFTPNKEIL